MASFSGVGIGLSFVFGCIFLGLIVELYYLLWWKKRINNREIDDDHFHSHATEISYLFCWKRRNSINNNSSSRNSSTQELTASVRNGHEQQQQQQQQIDLELGNKKDSSPLSFKPFGEESVESELMRLHNLCGPPRFLFTIKEETREDLESEDGKSRKGSRTRSLSDIIIAVDTPFLSPLASPPLKAQQQALDGYKNHGLNPLFESISEAELNRLRSSPPPKFKFLRDAEEKLIRRLVEEAEKRGSIAFIGNKSKERETANCLSSTPSQVLPLSTSPSTFKSGMK